MTTAGMCNIIQTYSFGGRDPYAQMVVRFDGGYAAHDRRGGVR